MAYSGIPTIIRTLLQMHVIIWEQRHLLYKGGLGEDTLYRGPTDYL